MRHRRPDERPEERREEVQNQQTTGRRTEQKRTNTEQREMHVSESQWGTHHSENASASAPTLGGRRRHRQGGREAPPEVSVGTCMAWWVLAHLPTLATSLRHYCDAHVAQGSVSSLQVSSLQAKHQRRHAQHQLYYTTTSNGYVILRIV